MEYETYADVIDAYNADNMGYSTLTDYIKGQNIKIKEIEMDPIGDMQKIFENKADGGVIGIEVKIADEMAKGGRVGLFSGGALKGLASLFKAGKDKIADFAETQANKKMFRSADDIPLSTYSEMKGPIKLSDMENIPEDQLKKILRTQELGLYEETPELLKAANLLERFTKKVGGKRVIDYERAEAILGVKLKGNETLDDLFKIEFETRPEMKADGGRVGLFMGGPPLEGTALNIYESMNAYGFSDQEIANAIKQAGYELPTADSGTGTGVTTPNIIGSQLKSKSAGDNFSVFNPNPNRIKGFIPEKGFAASMPANANLSLQGDYDIYGNKVRETLNPLQAGIRSVKNTMANVINNPVFQTIGAMMNPAAAAVKGVASLFKDRLPVNQRAIAENIAGQQGIRVDDIGRIVNTGKYTDPSNVMAGYNLNAITQETFDNRIGNISNTLADKYGMTAKEIQDAIDGTYTGPVRTNLIETIRAVKLANTNIMNIKNKAIETARREQELRDIARANAISKAEARGVRDAIDRENAAVDKQGLGPGPGKGNTGAASMGSGYNEGNYCFDPSTPIQMADGSEKKIKEIQLGDQTKGGEVTGVFQFKASDEIHDYKGVVVAGSHYVKEDGKFIMVQDSPISVKIDKIPVVYSLDTTGRRIFINDIEFADYNGDGVAKNFLTNAGVDLTGFDTEVLRQVEQRLI